MIKTRRRRFNTFKLGITFSSVSSSSITTSSSEEQFDPNWKYDAWELGFLTEKIKKKREKERINDFFELREQRKTEKNLIVPPLNLQIHNLSSSSQDTISPKSSPLIFKNLSQDSTIIYRKKEEEKIKSEEISYIIHIFPNSERINFNTLPCNKTLRKKSKKRKRWKSLVLSKRRASKSFIKVRKKSMVELSYDDK